MCKPCEINCLDLQTRLLEDAQAENAALRPIVSKAITRFSSGEDKTGPDLTVEEIVRIVQENAKLREALKHTFTCPLSRKAYEVMGDNPEGITACAGCKDALIFLRDS